MRLFIFFFDSNYYKVTYCIFYMDKYVVSKLF